jgi:hypothetical protein
MSDPRLGDLARRLEQLPREAWDRPAPPPPPWPSPAARDARRRRLTLRPLAASVAAAALLALGVAVGVLLGGGEDRGGDSTRNLALAPGAGRGRGATGSVSLIPRAGGDATVRVSGMRPNGRGDFYELWLLGKKGELVSLGSFRVPRSGDAELTVPLPVDPARFRYLDVSREPDDGDPAHSTISILRGPAV